ncbi:hypothetical protein [Polaribacter gangjinensis]|uniref:DUF1735 domain-containing protein n=1 Tax=Polaribacter gangjinensis TaxID=574710 RepID=A0A2S7WBH4_9FLAO|nr:hypothetical protein [Polaribacter gangjinensis]PQJ74979.1 hypothetical protein BTO13_06835 [Polaribacter gangjinensis]
MKKILLILLSFTFLLSFNSCTEEVEPRQTNYITFASTTYSTGIDIGGSETVEIPVYTANITSSDRSFVISVLPTSTAAAGSYTVPETITIPAGSNEGTLSIALSDTNLGIGINTLRLSFGVQEGLSTGPNTVLSYFQNCSEVTATLSITFDGYGSETGWTVTDALGGVVASKTAGAYADGQASASETITLCAGRDYTFTITDSYGDGLSFPANGSYSLTIGGVVKATGGGDFGASQATAFDTK